MQVLEAQLHNGDLLPTLIEGLNEPQRKALLEFVKASGGSIAPQEKGFFERLKEKLS